MNSYRTTAMAFAGPIWWRLSLLALSLLFLKACFFVNQDELAIYTLKSELKRSGYNKYLTKITEPNATVGALVDRKGRNILCAWPEVFAAIPETKDKPLVLGSATKNGLYAYAKSQPVISSLTPFYELLEVNIADDLVEISLANSEINIGDSISSSCIRRIEHSDLALEAGSVSVVTSTVSVPVEYKLAPKKDNLGEMAAIVQKLVRAFGNFELDLKTTTIKGNILLAYNFSQIEIPYESYSYSNIANKRFSKRSLVGVWVAEKWKLENPVSWIDENTMINLSISPQNAYGNSKGYITLFTGKTKRPVEMRLEVHNSNQHTASLIGYIPPTVKFADLRPYSKVRLNLQVVDNKNLEGSVAINGEAIGQILFKRPR